MKYTRECSEYSGEWMNGYHHGAGTLQYDNGNYYSGEWFEGMKHGYGINLINGVSRYEGEWNEDKMHGKGIFERLDKKWKKES